MTTFPRELTQMSADMLVLVLLWPPSSRNKKSARLAPAVSCLRRTSSPRAWSPRPLHRSVLRDRHGGTPRTVCKERKTWRHRCHVMRRSVRSGGPRSFTACRGPDPTLGLRLAAGTCGARIQEGAARASQRLSCSLTCRKAPCLTMCRGASCLQRSLSRSWRRDHSSDRALSECLEYIRHLRILGATWSPAGAFRCEYQDGQSRFAH